MKGEYVKYLEISGKTSSNRKEFNNVRRLREHVSKVYEKMPRGKDAEKKGG